MGAPPELRAIATTLQGPTAAAAGARLARPTDGGTKCVSASGSPWAALRTREHGDGSARLHPGDGRCSPGSDGSRRTERISSNPRREHAM